ncbi:hypothetical protein MRX96_015857 [Rhipicephalus microplus]
MCPALKRSPQDNPREPIIGGFLIYPAEAHCVTCIERQRPSFEKRCTVLCSARLCKVWVPSNLASAPARAIRAVPHLAATRVPAYFFSGFVRAQRQGSIGTSAGSPRIERWPRPL